MALSDRTLPLKTATGRQTKEAGFICPHIRYTVSLLMALAVAPIAKAQLPDAPSARVIAPLKRFSLNMGLDNKYSLTTSLYDLTPRLGMSVRLGERETMGLSYSHATVMNNKHVESNSVVMWLNFRVLSWGRIPRD